MTNKDAADLLDAFADVLEIRGANQFRVRAFRTASRRVDGLTVDLGELVASDSLESVQGIGKGIAGFLRELVTTGRVAEYEAMRAEIPSGVFDMLRVPGLGPKTAATLYTKLQITSIDELEAAARANELAQVRSIGAKRQERLLRELQRFRERAARHLLGDVLPLAEHLAAHVREAPGVAEATYARQPAPHARNHWRPGHPGGRGRPGAGDAALPGARGDCRGSRFRIDQDARAGGQQPSGRLAGGATRQLRRGVGVLHRIEGTQHRIAAPGAGHGPLIE